LKSSQKLNNTISVITVVYNGQDYLEETIQTVLKQTYQNKEYIIIDGGSLDDTVEIIKKYEDSIDYWISEPDNGIADAMNKGLKVAQGDYILFLHSDDYFLENNTLEKASQYLEQDHDLFLYNLYHSDNDRKTLSQPKGMGWRINFKTGVLHQSCICARSLFEKIGYFDTNFKITMDYDFFLRAYRAGIKTKRIDFPLSVMRLVGIGSRKDWEGLRERLLEERRVHQKNCNSIFLKIIYLFYWALYFPYKFFLANIKKAAFE
jgi:glycosyltransferase involved in cell wall biosynthesis